MTQRGNGVTAPQGFVAAAVHAGIKKPGVPDLALIASVQEGPIAGVFTRNRIAAAPVILDRAHLRQKIGRGILINSGNANACTGARGLADARELATLVAGQIGTAAQTIFVGSTGVIGQPLPMAGIRRAIPELVKRLRRAGAQEAARAILTTDQKTKEVALSARIAGRTVTVGGMAKGSGMIHPDMATLLASLTTDAAIEQRALQSAVRAAVTQSFNCISVDGDTSTNDTVLCLANALAGNALVRMGSTAFGAFQRLLTQACMSLAMQICRDGEGATKVAQVVVTGARTDADARQVARTIATSSLVKTALFGEDANWGRILAAVGRSGVPIHPNKICLAFEGIPIVKGGTGLGASVERRIARIMRRKEFAFTVDLKQGSGTARQWTTDLSYEYVRINASYRS